MSEDATKNDDEDSPRNSKKCQKEDLISSAIGDFGRWQLFLTFALSLVNIPCTWHIFVPTFHAASRDTWCSRTKSYENITPKMWINCTGQNSDFCSMYDLIYSNDTNSDLCTYANSSHRTTCANWEFGGVGKIIFSIILLRFC